MLKLNLEQLNCPLPILKLKKFLLNIDHSELIQITTTDPASINDFKEFCLKTGHNLISQNINNGIITSIIQKRKLSI